MNNPAPLRAEGECCRKCVSWPEESPNTPGFRMSCVNSNCECHTQKVPTPTGWRDSLSKVVKEQEDFSASWGQFYLELKAFIEKVERAAEERMAERVVEYIRKTLGEREIDNFTSKTLDEARHLTDKKA